MIKAYVKVVSSGGGKISCTSATVVIKRGERESRRGRITRKGGSWLTGDKQGLRIRYLFIDDGETGSGHGIDQGSTA